ncbi:MAG: ketopantoate reductase C-terminal domain-containing protein, partial [Sciscionella sp.]
LGGAERVGDHKTSMLQDLECGKQLELDAIVTAVVELADMTGAEAPTLRAVHAAVDLLSRCAGTASRGPTQLAGPHS